MKLGLEGYRLLTKLAAPAAAGRNREMAMIRAARVTGRAVSSVR